MIHISLDIGWWDGYVVFAVDNNQSNEETMNLQTELSGYCDRLRTTHYQVAKQLNIPISYTYQIKRGNETRVPLRIRLRIAAHIGLDWDFELLYTNGEDDVPEMIIVYKRMGDLV